MRFATATHKPLTEHQDYALPAEKSVCAVSDVS